MFRDAQSPPRKNSLNKVCIQNLVISMYTSSTEQGSGGSFKNRKPIGEIGCCESRIAERIHWWTERCLKSPLSLSLFLWQLESRRRRTKGSVVGEEWCQNVAPLRRYTKNFFAQSKMILSRAWLHDTVSCAAWNDARKGVYLKPLFKTPCSNCYWGWSKPIMLDYRDISLMESVPLMWGPVTASPVGIEPMTIFGGGGPPYNWYPIHNGENSMNSTGWPPNTP